MPTTCEINFENNPEKVLYTGQLLCGTINLTLTTEKTVRGVYILITGKAYCLWRKGSSKSRKTYTGSEDYINEKMYLYGDENGDHSLLPGTYNYRFQCMLPPELPTSVEANIGHIRYVARVVIDIPFAFDKEFDCPFTVIKSLNLNAIPALREPAMAETEKSFLLCCLLCCLSDPMKIVARTPVGGYTPGQTINLELDIINRSDQPVSDFTVQLIKKISYFTYANSSRTTSEAIVITEQETRGCDVNQTEKIRVNIFVPPIPPTDFSTSNIVKVRYSIRIIGTVACCHYNPELELEITIGSYPLQDNPHPYLYLDASVLQPTNDMVSTRPTAPLMPQSLSRDLDSNDDPPTYEEAITHSRNPNDNTFKPKYAMFKRTTSYSSGN